MHLYVFFLVSFTWSQLVFVVCSFNRSIVRWFFSVLVAFSSPFNSLLKWRNFAYSSVTVKFLLLLILHDCNEVHGDDTESIRMAAHGPYKYMTHAFYLCRHLFINIFLVLCFRGKKKYLAIHGRSYHKHSIRECSSFFPFVLHSKRFHDGVKKSTTFWII